jgi:hypothetical protein
MGLREGRRCYGGRVYLPSRFVGRSEGNVLGCGAWKCKLVLTILYIGTEPYDTAIVPNIALIV